ncbi:DNA-binding transcriptional ArsR family regulator [Haloferula luteola]|uniref:DNA-binding transcriptional ArsR family regulator n=1 Tax=Haloferula luteola TaxID=595692 RepID=A0A840V5W1_9BACT|nr:metalloregulator ArsR/SmtB family transcription factor [Haloferula luteola]MBB5353637.1 DNA-binding transcriptional ArsR family regulator [Haloferula luteola]
MKLESAELERVATFFRAFSEPTRLSLLQEMKDGGRTVGELVDVLPTTQANVSKQLKILHEAGLIDRVKEGTSVRYSICEPVVLELCRIACDKLNRDALPRKLTF